MPFIRYAIGDMGLMDDSRPCRCGRGLPRLRSVTGRVLDSLRTADGRLVPGEFFPHVIKEVPEVVHFQVEQKSLDHLVISAVCSEPLSENSRNLLSAEIRKVFGSVMQWELCPVKTIPLLRSGKRRVTIGLG
jgi:phenylacetate-CoA ligase